MKKLFFILGSTFLSAQSGNVGINTVTPRVTLDIKGDYYSDKIIIPNLEATPVEAKDRYQLLTQSVTDNSIRIIDPTQNNSPGIASIITYKLENVYGDWVENFDTKIKAADYALVVLSGYFDTDVAVTVKNGLALPAFGTKNTNGTWRLYADYPGLGSVNGNGTWTIMCAVYPKTYVKIFPQQEIDLQTLSTGTAETAILN